MPDWTNETEWDLQQDSPVKSALTYEARTYEYGRRMAEADMRLDNYIENYRDDMGEDD